MAIEVEPRQLDVWLEQQRIGELYEQGNLWALHYDPVWRDNGFDLSPALPRNAGEIQDGGSQRPVQWFFDNLLPEEGGRPTTRGLRRWPPTSPSCASSPPTTCSKHWTPSPWQRAWSATHTSKLC